VADLSFRWSDGEVLTGRIAGQRGDDVAAVVESFLRVHRGTRVSITGGTVGVVNTGEICDVQSISANAYDLTLSGAVDVAKALTCIAEAVAHAVEMPAKTRGEVLHQLRELSRQALLPAEDRAPSGILKAITTAASNSLQTVAALAQIWSTWGAPIQRFFGF
jgi:hypothetical protein